MPVMDGYDACKKMKEISQRTKIIAQTADITENNVEKCLQHKFDQVLFKPIDRKKLLSVLN